MNMIGCYKSISSQKAEWMSNLSMGMWHEISYWNNFLFLFIAFKASFVSKATTSQEMQKKNRRSEIISFIFILNLKNSSL